jgi:hypothetical protein
VLSIANPKSVSQLTRAIKPVIPMTKIVSLDFICPLRAVLPNVGYQFKLKVLHFGQIRFSPRSLSWLHLLQSPVLLIWIASIFDSFRSNVVISRIFTIANPKPCVSMVVFISCFCSVVKDGIFMSALHLMQCAIEKIFIDLPAVNMDKQFVIFDFFLLLSVRVCFRVELIVPQFKETSY